VKLCALQAAWSIHKPSRNLALSSISGTPTPKGVAYWGKAVTDANGQFSFRTYVPGTYGGRPSHIHYIVWRGDKRLLTSQVYFKGFDAGSGAALPSARHDLREARLIRANATDFATDFRVVVA